MHQKILKSMLVMHRNKERKKANKLKSKVYFPSFSHDVLVLYSLREVFSTLPYMYLISVFPCCCVFFPIYGRKYSMKAKLFMENMWELSLCFLPHTKLIFPCMQGDLNKSNTRNIYVGCK